jgi:hypothetical protein
MEGIAMGNKVRKRAALIILTAALVLLLPAVAALAQSGGPYDLTWNSVDGGGATFSSGGDYTLGGTGGQPDAGVMKGGDYTIGGGFWCGGEVAGAMYDVYLPLILRR